MTPSPSPRETNIWEIIQERYEQNKFNLCCKDILMKVEKDIAVLLQRKIDKLKVARDMSDSTDRHKDFYNYAILEFKDLAGGILE